MKYWVRFCAILVLVGSLTTMAFGQYVRRTVLVTSTEGMQNIVAAGDFLSTLLPDLLRQRGLEVVSVSENLPRIDTDDLVSIAVPLTNLAAQNDADSWVLVELSQADADSEQLNILYVYSDLLDTEPNDVIGEYSAVFTNLSGGYTSKVWNQLLTELAPLYTYNPDGTFTLVVEPAGSTLLVNDAFIPVSDGSVELDAPAITEQDIIVFKDGYYPQAHAILLNPKAPELQLILAPKFPVMFDLLLYDVKYPTLRASFILNESFPEFFLSVDVKTTFGLNLFTVPLEENSLIATDGLEEVSLQFGALFLPTYFPLRGYASIGPAFSTALFTPTEEYSQYQRNFSPSVGVLATVGIEFISWLPVRFIFEYVPRFTLALDNELNGLNELELTTFQFGIRWQP